MPNSLVLLAAIATLFSYFGYALFHYGHRTRDMPSGPPTLPFIGNLHVMPSSYTHIKFTEWARKYGKLYTLKLGSGTMAVITDPALVRSTVDKKSTIYSHRPTSFVSHDLITKGNHLLVMYYGEKWRTFRRLVHQFLTDSMVERVHLPIVNAEAIQLVHDYMVFPEDHMLHPKRFSNSVSNSIVFGIRTASIKGTYMGRLYTLMEEWSKLMETGHTPPVDIFPFLKALPEIMFDRYKTRSLAVGKQMETLYEDILSEVITRREKDRSKVTSFMDTILDLQEKNELPRDQLRFIGGVLMEGGSDTSSSLILAIIQALINNPDVQRKAHAELDQTVGAYRSPVWSDMVNLPYINMIVKEGHRWRPILPLCFPHALGEDDWVDGKFLPKGTTIILNVWGMHMDEKEWTNPKNFEPERYRNHPSLATDYVASDNRDHFGYGAGRRICPGIHLAERNMLLSIAKLLWAFRFEAEVDAEGKKKLVDDDPVTGYHQGFLYCPKTYSCKPVVRSEKVRETVLREYSDAKIEIFSQFSEG